MTRESAARQLERGVRPAALLGWADDRAKGSVRGRTVSAVWSPGSRKVKKKRQVARQIQQEKGRQEAERQSTC